MSELPDQNNSNKNNNNNNNNNNKNNNNNNDINNKNTFVRPQENHFYKSSKKHVLASQHMFCKRALYIILKNEKKEEVKHGKT